MKSKLKLTAVFEKAAEGGYIAFVEELPGVNSEGETIEEAKANLEDALELMLDTQRELMEMELSSREVIKQPLQID